MGFQNLVVFNKALLTKQVWRLISKPMSLVPQVYKARYFKHFDIMEAEVGPNASYVWRSLCWSSDLIGIGLLWKIGTGVHINIYKDSWVPHVAQPHIFSGSF